MSSPSPSQNNAMMWTGLSVAIAGFVADRLFKWYMLDPFDIAVRGKVTLTPFFDLVLAWNYGISYGLFQADGDLGRLALIVFALAVVGGLGIWLWRTKSWLLAIALGLVIGGAVGNVYDRFVYGAVADFFSFHAWGFYWYIFNLADVWITLGIMLILLESFLPQRQPSTRPDQEVPK